MITKVWERLYVGSLKDANRLAFDNSIGVTTIVSLCTEEVLPKFEEITYEIIPIADARPISAEQFEEIMEAIARHIRGGTVLLMCAAGMSRSPAMAAAWMHRCGYLNFDAGVQRITELRPITDPSPILLRSVKEQLNR